MGTKITVSASIASPLDKVWEAFTEPQHITKWNFATDDWHCPKAINDLTPGGKFSWRMEALDASMGFDFAGQYISITEGQQIVYTLDDGRTVEISFQFVEGCTNVTETLEAEDMNPVEMQESG